MPASVMKEKFSAKLMLMMLRGVLIVQRSSRVESLMLEFFIWRTLMDTMLLLWIASFSSD